MLPLTVYNYVRECPGLCPLVCVKFIDYEAFENVDNNHVAIE